MLDPVNYWVFILRDMLTPVSTPTSDPRRELGRLEEAGAISRAVIRAADEIKANFGEAVAPLGVPAHLARAVIMLDDPSTMSELAERLRCDPSYVTSLADQLEERGLAGRAQGADRRVKLLALTDDGRALRARVAATISAESIVLSRLDDAQRAALLPLLEQLLGESPIR